LDRFASVVFAAEGFSLAWAIDQLSANVARELDFELEAQNSERCRLFFQKHHTLSKRVAVPRVHLGLSTKKMLVMDYAHGIPVNALVEATQQQAAVVRERKRANNVSGLDSCQSQGDASPQVSHDPQDLLAAQCSLRVADSLVEAFAAMFFCSGFFHCDPHPGNILVEMPSTAAASPSAAATVVENKLKRRGHKAPEEPVLVLLDHGIYWTLQEPARLATCRLWQAIMLQYALGV